MIHIEQQWTDNGLTADGSLLHERVHDPFLDEKRGDRLIIRGMPVASSALKVRGVCDAVEFRRDASGVPLHGRDGAWRPTPVEYKRGDGAVGDSDRAQLCLQGMCLEEMLCCPITGGFLYYGAARHREAVAFTDELRERVRDALTEMHRLFLRGYTPRVRTRPGCRSCSLREICLPALGKCPSAKAYIDKTLREETEAQS